MRISDLYSQFDTAYKNAKLLVKHDEAEAARDYIIACMSIMREIYLNTTGVMERARIYAHICNFKNISATLHESGVTAEVKVWFGIAETAEPAKKPSAASSPIDKIMYDDSIDWAAELFAQYSRCVVIISARSGGMISGGTGFIISEKGYILTNDHVVFDENRCDYHKKVTMTTTDGKEVPLVVISSDKKNDVALCSFDVSLAGKVVPVKRISDYSKLLPGVKVLMIGNGLSMGLAPLTGDVKFPHDNSGNLVTTIPSNHGDSGGPVFNRKGECVGINKSITVSVTRGSSTVEAQGITNATPMDKIDELLAKWCEQNGIEL